MLIGGAKLARNSWNIGITLKPLLKRILTINWTISQHQTEAILHRLFK